MTKTLILTFIADDRPGLVERIAKTVAEHDGNWLDSRMAHLAAKFAGVAKVEIDDGKASTLEAALQNLQSEGFHLVVEDATDDVLAEPGQLFDLELLGPDHPGIVRDISHFLAERGISVEEMETDIREAPHTGGTLFHAWAKVRAPMGLGDDAFGDALDALADELMVEITVIKAD